MSNSFLDAAFRRSQTSFTEVNAVTPPKGLGSVHIGATVVNEVTLGRIRDPRLFQSLGDRQDLRPIDNPSVQYLVVIIAFRLA